MAYVDGWIKGPGHAVLLPDDDSLRASPLFHIEEDAEMLRAVDSPVFFPIHSRWAARVSESKHLRTFVTDPEHRVTLQEVVHRAIQPLDWMDDCILSNRFDSHSSSLIAR